MIEFDDIVARALYELSLLSAIMMTGYYGVPVDGDDRLHVVE